MKFIIPTSALMLATAAAAQTPPVSGTTNSTQPDAAMPADSSPMTDDMDMSDDPSATMPSEDMPSEAMPSKTMPSTTMPSTTMPAPRAMPATPPMNRTMPRSSAMPPTQAAGSASGMNEYPMCSKTVTDSCVNPNDVRRGIAKRPSRR